MNRTTRRFLLASIGTTSVLCLLGAGSPRIQAWNDKSNASMIADTRAATCQVTTSTIVPNTAIADSKGRPIPDGTYLCDWAGNTAQVSNGGFIGYVRSGQPEKISQTLTKRGFKRP